MAFSSYAKNCAVVGTLCQYFGDSTDIPILPHGIIQPSLFESYNPIINSSVLINRSYCRWKECDLEDYELWLRITLSGGLFYNIPRILTWHRIHRNSAFNSKHMSDKHLRDEFARAKNSILSLVS